MPLLVRLGIGLLGVLHFIIKAVLVILLHKLEGIHTYRHIHSQMDGATMDTEQISITPMLGEQYLEVYMVFHPTRELDELLGDMLKGLRVKQQNKVFSKWQHLILPI